MERKKPSAERKRPSSPRPQKPAPLEELTAKDLEKVIGGLGIRDDNTTWFSALPKIQKR